MRLLRGSCGDEHALFQRGAERIVVGAAESQMQMFSPALGVSENARDTADLGVELGHRVEIGVEPLAFVEPQLVECVAHVVVMMDAQQNRFSLVLNDDLTHALTLEAPPWPFNATRFRIGAHAELSCVKLPLSCL